MSKFSHQQQFEIGLYANYFGGTQAIKRFRSCSLSQAYYFKKKVKTGRHWNKNGGRRNNNFKVSIQNLFKILYFIQTLCFISPDLPLKSYCTWIYLLFNIQISVPWISSAFSKILGYSYKRMQIFQNLKYTSENIDYYFEYLFWIKDQNPIQIKFLDESHFDGRGTQCKFGRGPINQRVIGNSNLELSERCSLTLITSLVHTKPYFVEYRDASNCQEDFLFFILRAILAGYLVPGDILICDNASIHHGQDTISQVQDLLDSVGISFVSLPTFSPELNPCELVFNFVKGKIYRTLERKESLQIEIEEHLSKLTPQQLLKMYIHSRKGGDYLFR